MRTGEVFALTWNDIDLEKRIIKINKTVYAKDKDNNGRWYLGTTKTEGSSREVYICDTLYEKLLDYQKMQNKYKNQYGKKYKLYYLKPIKNQYGKLIEYKVANGKSKYNNVDMVFTRKNGHYAGTDISKYPFKIIHHELGLNCRFYDLRGSFATISLRNGCEIKDIAEVLGHNDKLSDSQRYYITSNNNDKKKVVELFDKTINLVNKR